MSRVRPGETVVITRDDRIEIGADAVEAEEFVCFLKEEGYDARVISRTGTYVNGCLVLEGSDLAAALSHLRGDFHSSQII